MDFLKERELFLAFQKRWSIDKVKSMTLDEYTSTKVLSNGNRDDFTFWIENKLEPIGSIWGGSSFKFGIYRQDNNEAKTSDKTRCYDKDYGWYLKYGNTSQEAFKKVKNLILEVIEASQANNLEVIDSIDLGDAFKWKIAFHYQNINDVRIVDIFQTDTLKRINRSVIKNKKFVISKIHRELLGDKTYSLETMCREKSYILWEQYGESMLDLYKKYLEKKFKNKNTRSSYHSNMKAIEKKFSLKLEDLKFMDDFLRTKTDLETNPDFISFDNANNSAYSNALKHYYDFLLEYTNSDTNQDEANILEDSSRIETNENNTTKYQPFNQILYGPPGTGKTYHTINKALEILAKVDQSIDEAQKKEILEILENLNSNSPSPEKRQRAKEIFDDFKNKKQIEFITFHQSYGYEEFVEGIKPIPSENENNVSYKVTQGIFKRLCEVAEQNYKEAHPNKYGTELKIENLVDAYLNDLRKQLDNATNGYLEIEGEEGIKIKILGINSNNGLVMKKENVKDPQTISTAKGSILYRDYQNFLDGKIQNKEEVKPAENSKNKQHGNAEYYLAFYKTLKNFADNAKINQDSIPESKPLKPYILVIDEINRGNVSKIFGELITLIEPSKRIGADEELRVTLPYSGSQAEDGETKELFGVPSNLYIIGTMNTADRSITSLDTALRRRFEFVEMMPDAEILKYNYMVTYDKDNKTNEDFYPDEDKYYFDNQKYCNEMDYDYIKEDKHSGIILFNILNSINQRIEFLLGREKLIGHANFIAEAKFFDHTEWKGDEGFGGEVSWYHIPLPALKRIFQNKIIPLLQEYCYNDYAMINIILNGNKMIFEKPKPSGTRFEKYINEMGYEDRKLYEITPYNNDLWLNIETYVAIYNDKVAEKLRTQTKDTSKEQNEIQDKEQSEKPQ